MAAPRTKLFVGHLPDGCTNEELQRLFEEHGTVTECDVISKYGFVHMSTPEEADSAINALNEFNFKGSSLSVERSKSKLHPEPGAPGRAQGQQTGFRGRGGYGYANRGRGYSNGYNRYDSGGYGGVRDYYGRSDGGYGISMNARMRPYPMPYDRPSMGPPRDEYSYRPSPYDASAVRDPYARPPMPPARDLYERRVTSYPTANDYLYSRRSPSQMTSNRGYGDYYGDAYADAASRVPPTARRPYF